MKKMMFDVMVVYSAGITVSARSRRRVSTPFAAANDPKKYSLAYSYLLKACHDRGVTAILGVGHDIVGAGTVNGYWSYENNVWKRKRGLAKARVIFDKLSPTTDIKIHRRSLLFSKANITPFNTDQLYQLFFDKYHLFEHFGELTVPTVKIRAQNQTAINRSITKLLKMMTSSDKRGDYLSEFILKDRFGAAGNHVYKVDINDLESIGNIVKHNSENDFILQPRINFENGYKYKSYRGQIEIRVIIANTKIVQAYLRMPEENGYLCNGSQGGSIVYIDPEKLPKSIHQEIVKAQSLIESSTDIYSLDYIISDQGNIYLLEGNTGPGITWDPENKDDVEGAKKLIRIIADNLAMRVIKRHESRYGSRHNRESFDIISRLGPIV